ncbi:UvrD-helicase domain-containing protein, partial [candidate division WWE3 bacterium]|nr:UvrD-helicase domain-containing protein [candidate division WWE3 bacterium]
MSEMKLNANQQAAVTHEGSPLLIIAGAGTGKTTVITERIKWLIQEKGLKPDEILALTFTEKAAAEMEERVDVALPMGYTQTWIMTFHGFCERLLRNEAVQIGLDPGFRVLSEAETQLFIRDHLFEFELEYFRPQGNPTKFLNGLTTHFSRLKDEDVSPDQYIGWVEGYKVEMLEGGGTTNLETSRS